MSAPAPRPAPPPAPANTARAFELIPLGTGGFIPSGRHTMSFLLLADGVPLVLDAGSGVARLLEPAIAERLAGVERLDILLTHYHLDHVIGLSYLPGVWPGKPVRIIAPSPPLVDVPGEAAVRQLISPPLFPLDLESLPNRIEFVAITAPATGLGLLGLPLAVRRQRHPGGSIGVRLGDAIAYVTDTAADPETARFARGVHTLMHEVWVSDREAQAQDPGSTGHAAAGRVAEIARAAGCRRLIPVHHHPRRDAAEVEDLARSLAAACGSAIEVLVPTEGQCVRWTA